MATGDIFINRLRHVAITGGTITGLSSPLPIASGGSGTITGSITGTTALTFAAGGSNQNVTITPSGSGYTILNGSVGVGITAPSATIHSVGTIFPMYLDCYYAGSSAPAGVYGRKSRGSVSSPSAVLEDDMIVAYGAYGYKVSDFGFCGAVRIYAAETFTDSKTGSYITFNTNLIGGVTVAEKARITDAGNFGINTIHPDRRADFLDTANPQLRLTHTDGTVYCDMWATSTGDLKISNTGDCVFIGLTAGNVNTGDNNIGIGSSALLENTTGISNTAIGVNSLTHNTIGTSNTGIGLSALHANTTGINNTAVGTSALDSVTTGSNLTAIGYDADASSATAVNEVTLGNASVATLRCQVQVISALSDERDKKNIKDIPVGLDFINRLKPREFDWNMRDGGKVDIHEMGFVAQELLAAQKEEGVTVPGLVYDSNPDKLEAAYGYLVPVLVKAFQELTVKNNEKDILIASLVERISALEN